MDTAYRDDELKDPEHTNPTRADWHSMGVHPRAPSQNKEHEWAVGGRRDLYASEDDPESAGFDDEEVLDEPELTDAVIEGICRHVDSWGRDGLAAKVRSRLRGQGYDTPPDFAGRPHVGGGQTGNRAMDTALMAMDVKTRMSRMSRPERDRFVRDNRKLVDSVNRFTSTASRSFAKRWPTAKRIGFAY
jgi:hypothetical protein